MIISEHEPRKGTETSRGVVAIDQRVFDFRTRTPKGDGNGVELGFKLAVLAYFRTRTPKGDGNIALLPVIGQDATDFRTRTPKGDGNITQ